MARSNRRRSRIDANDLAAYGSVANGTVNVDKAARGLGASKTEVRQAIRQAEAAQSNTFYRRISGRREADSAEGTSIRGMLQAAFGRGPNARQASARDVRTRTGPRVDFISFTSRDQSAPALRDAITAFGASTRPWLMANSASSSRE